MVNKKFGGFFFISPLFSHTYIIPFTLITNDPKITFGNRSDRGAINHSVAMNFTQTAKLHGYNV